jgi:hypothetical protein
LVLLQHARCGLRKFAKKGEPKKKRQQAANTPWQSLPEQNFIRQMNFVQKNFRAFWGGEIVFDRRCWRKETYGPEWMEGLW